MKFHKRIHVKVSYYDCVSASFLEKARHSVVLYFSLTCKSGENP